MGKEARIGIGIIGTLLVVLVAALAWKMARPDEPATSRESEASAGTTDAADTEPAAERDSPTVLVAAAGTAPPPNEGPRTADYWTAPSSSEHDAPSAPMYPDGGAPQDHQSPLSESGEPLWASGAAAARDDEVPDGPETGVAYSPATAFPPRYGDQYMPPETIPANAYDYDYEDNEAGDPYGEGRGEGRAAAQEHPLREASGGASAGFAGAASAEPDHRHDTPWGGQRQEVDEPYTPGTTGRYGQPAATPSRDESPYADPSHPNPSYASPSYAAPSYTGPSAQSPPGSPLSSSPSYTTPSGLGQAAAVPASRGPAGENLRSADGTYEVRPNDSYWTISQRLYGTGAFFKALAQHNRLKHPHADRLRVGDTILAPTEEELTDWYPDLCPRPEHREAMERRATAASTSGGYAGGRVYVVEQGDTLFDIARYELGRASRWVDIYQLNRQQLGPSFDYLTPGMRLVLPEDGGGDNVASRPDALTPR